MLIKVLFIWMIGCSENKVDDEDAQGSSKSDSEYKEEEDKESEELEECPEGFDPEVSCEGTWESTICLHGEVIWWCQDGEWLNEEEK